MVRCASFAPEEDTALARCWVSVSARYDEQNAATFWKNIFDTFSTQSEASERLRSAGGLHSRWQVLQKPVQKYLTADRMYRLKPNRAQRTSIQIPRCCGNFASLPKFGATCSKRSSNVVASFDSDGSAIGVAQADLAGPPATATGVGSIPASSPSTARPIGIKKSKRKKCPQRAKFGLPAIATAISSVVERKAQIKEAQIRIACENALLNIPAKIKLLIEMLSSKALSLTTESTANASDAPSRWGNCADRGNLLCIYE
eukprot:IDg3660t1